MKFKYLALVATTALFFTACSSTAPAPSPSPEALKAASPTVIKMEKTIQLGAQNGSGESGTAVVTAGPNGNAIVTLTLVGGDIKTPQPAHIHLGSCPNPGAVKYPLTEVVDGKSVTTLDASYEDIAKATEKMAINLHKSAQELKAYTACGDLN